MTIDTAPKSALKPNLPSKPRAFSGIQPSGVTHLGNDLGAIRNYVALQNRGGLRDDLLHRRLPRPDQQP
jgi:hypothetical protein